MNPLELLNALKDYSKSLTLLEERHAKQMTANATVDSELAALRKAIAELTTRVAVLEEGRNAIDDRVRRVMTEVIADWQQQHSDRERKRLEDEVAMLRRSLPGS